MEDVVRTVIGATVTPYVCQDLKGSPDSTELTVSHLTFMDSSYQNYRAVELYQTDDCSGTANVYGLAYPIYSNRIDFYDSAKARETDLDYWFQGPYKWN